MVGATRLGQESTERLWRNSQYIPPSYTMRCGTDSGYFASARGFGGVDLRAGVTPSGLFVGKTMIKLKSQIS